MPRLSLPLILAAVLFPLAAHAQQVAYLSPQGNQDQSNDYAAAPAMAAPQTSGLAQPDLLSFGGGYIDFDKNEPRTQAAGFRLEYRWGHSLYTTGGDTVNFQIHPLVGGDVSTRSQLYGFGGFAFDVLFWQHLVFTESEAVGLFDSGDAKPLGSFIEFRSQAELGWRFDDNIRVTAALSHISNAGLTHRNPGEEIAGGYIHIPVGMLFGQ